jgi:hypothetical protein
MKPPADPDPRFSSAPTLFFGIGAQKAGTTWVHDYLMSHPQARVPFVKEVHYWTRHTKADVGFTRRRTGTQKLAGSLRRAARRVLNGGAWSAADEREAHARCIDDRDPRHKDYADVLFGPGTNARAVGEITPAYALLDADDFRAMHGLAENVRFFFIMRDPIQRLLSGLRMEVIRKRLDPEGDAPKELIRQALADDPRLWLRRSRYDLTLETLDRAVPQDRVACFFYEDLFREAEIERLCGFLGLDTHRPDFGKRSQPASVRSKAGDGKAAEVGVDPGLFAALREKLEPAYEYVANRFGERAPASWSFEAPRVGQGA